MDQVSAFFAGDVPPLLAQPFHDDFPREFIVISEAGGLDNDGAIWRRKLRGNIKAAFHGLTDQKLFDCIPGGLGGFTRRTTTGRESKTEREDDAKVGSWGLPCVTAHGRLRDHFSDISSKDHDAAG